MASTELFYELPYFKGLNSNISAFYDIGRAYMSKNITNEKARTLQSYGVGYHGSYKDLFLNAYLARGIDHDVESQSKYNSRLLVQAGWVF